MNEKSSRLTHNLIKVLLVEDNPGDARLLREMLVEAAYALFKLTHVERLSEALKRLSEEAFDLVLLDLSLPDGQGLETFTTVHAQAPGVPIVVLTGLDDETLAVRAVQAGAQDYLVKGRVDGDLLMRAMRYAIERHRIMRGHRLSRQVGIEAKSQTESMRYVSSILKMNEDTLELIPPKLVRILPGTEVILTELGVSGKPRCYSTIAVAQRQDKKTGEWVLVVTQPESVQIPKRGLYREPVSLPVDLIFIDTGQTVAATSIDLSGSGIQIALKDPLCIEKALKVRVKFQLNDLGFNQAFDIPSTVVRSSQDKSQGMAKTHVALQFDAARLEARTQDQIIRYITKHQLHQRHAR